MLGFTPGLGAAADAGNALAYAVEGNWSEAGWSLGALFPVAGDFVAGARKGKGLISWLLGKGAKTCRKNPNSFPPGTLVLMADGTTKPIEDIHNGDHVLATDPETGETSTETVTAEITGNGTKHLVKITISTSSDNGKNGKTAEVTATDGHPFWIPELGEWIDATDLTTGQWLKTSTGTHTQITAIQRWTTTSTTVHNLTISDHHTYYVLAGDTPILVHNSGGLGPGQIHLWRGVTANELADISANRTWNSPQGVKYFSFTEKGAAEYSRRAYAAYPNEGPYTMIRTTVNVADLPEGARMAYTADVIDGGVALNNDELKILGRPSIMTGMSTGVGCG